MDRYVYDPGAKCYKCMEPIGFYKIESGKGAGKWAPCNPDGSDHWDLCREEAIKKGLKEPGVDYYFGGRTLGDNFNGIPYDGDAPPWDKEADPT